MKVIVTGATGMVGEGVMHECLLDPNISEVLIINRRPSGFSHAKLKEIIHKDFFDFHSIKEQLKGYDACYHCMGVSSVGMKEEQYSKLTYDITHGLMKILRENNPGMCVCYVSGSGTDSSEKGKLMWARVKGKTENDILNMKFRDAYMFRPGFMKPTAGLKNAYKAYALFTPFFPVLRALFPGFVCTLSEVGRAMINATVRGDKKKILEVRDIVSLAK